MWKYAGELCVGDIWTDQTVDDRDAQGYQVTSIAPGPAPTTIRVTGSSLTTGRRDTIDFFLVNRVKVRKKPAESA
jgi:hypothetical protein